MNNRRARFAYEPLTDWPYPEVSRVSAPFSAPWSATRDLLLAEADQLGATLVVVELDLTRQDLRIDGQIRANARLSSGRVRISLDTRHGALRYAVDKYLGVTFTSGQPPLLAWHANARAIALTLQALRAVDRYGAVHSAEQYQGFRALPAASSATAGFSSADEALRWLRSEEVSGVAGGGGLSPQTAYRSAVRRFHPDAGGDPAQWARLDEAKRLLETADLW